MENIKYTTDGKKVKVLGNLNSQEKIVQEIFIVNESEIPSGEHFVVKTLHDAPAVSWKEKNLKEIEEKYAKTYQKKLDELDKLERSFDRMSQVIRLKLNFLNSIEKTLGKQDFKRLINCISLNIKYLVISNYSELHIVEFNEEVQSIGSYGRLDGIKLLTIIGQGNSIAYRLNKYSDGSGSNKDIFPCATLKEAKSLVKEIYNQRIADFDGNYWKATTIIKNAEIHKFSVPKAVKDVYVNQKQEELQKLINSKTSEIERLTNELKNLS